MLTSQSSEEGKKEIMYKLHLGYIGILEWLVHFSFKQGPHDLEVNYVNSSIKFKWYWRAKWNEMNHQNQVIRWDMEVDKWPPSCWKLYLSAKWFLFKGVRAVSDQEMMETHHQRQVYQRWANSFFRTEYEYEILEMFWDYFGGPLEMLRRYSGNEIRKWWRPITRDKCMSANFFSYPSLVALVSTLLSQSFKVIVD